MVNGSTGARAAGPSVVVMGTELASSAGTGRTDCRGARTAVVAAVVVASLFIAGCGRDGTDEGGADEGGSESATTELVTTLPTTTSAPSSGCALAPIAISKLVGSYRHGELPAKIIEVLSPLEVKWCQSVLHSLLENPTAVTPVPVEVGNKVVQVPMSLDQVAGESAPPTSVVGGGSRVAQFGACVATFGYSSALVNLCMERGLVPTSGVGSR